MGTRTTNTAAMSSRFFHKRVARRLPSLPVVEKTSLENRFFPTFFVGPFFYFCSFHVVALFGSVVGIKSRDARAAIHTEKKCWHRKTTGIEKSHFVNVHLNSRMLSFLLSAHVLPVVSGNRYHLLFWCSRVCFVLPIP